MGILALHFYPIGSRINKNVIGPNSYKKGTANLTPNAQKMVNKLWIKGGKAISELYTQNITISLDAIPLNYIPLSPITVTINNEVKTLGIQNINQPGAHDFLINSNEKLLIPDLCKSGTGTISYCYEYPIKILLEDPKSQQTYGIFEDKLDVTATDKMLALELGFNYLYKYSEPVISGTIEPFSGSYLAGELVKVELPDININQYLKISEASYTSTPLSRVNIKLTLETPERNLSNILKDMNQRLMKLEKETYKDDDSIVEKYIAKEEYYNWSEEAVKADPIQSVEWEFWNEDVSMNSHLLLVPSETLYPNETQYP